MRKHISWRVRGRAMAESWSRSHGAYLCAYCFERMTENDVVIDHVMPLALGGTDDVDNLQVTCGRCNAWKSDKHPHDAEAHINSRLAVLHEAGCAR